jgi:hypothetical protein
MGARLEGSASKAGLALLGLLSAAGFVPLLVAAPTIIGDGRSAVAMRPLSPRPTPVVPLGPRRVEHSVVFVPEAVPSDAPPPLLPAPEPPVAPEPAAVETPAPTPAPPAPAPEELVAVAPVDPAPSGFVALGGGLTTAAAPATSLVPVPLVETVVAPLLGSLLGR